jgi:DNA polymerase III alpha subunit
VGNSLAAECHALTTYRCFWLKTYYPNEYKDALIPTINTTK